MKVRFNDCEEFLKELAERPPDDLLVRITQRFTSSEFSPAVKRIHVIATYYRAPSVVQLKRYIGDYWGDHERKALDKGEEVVKLLTQNCEEMGCKVGAGVIEP